MYAIKTCRGKGQMTDFQWSSQLYNLTKGLVEKLLKQKIQNRITKEESVL